MRFCPVCRLSRTDDVLECYGSWDRPHEAAATEPLEEAPPPPDEEPTDPPAPAPPDPRAALLVQAAKNYEAGVFADTAFLDEAQAILNGER